MNHPAEAVACPLCSAKHLETTILSYPQFRHMDFSVFHSGPNRLARCPDCHLVFRIMGEDEQREIESLYCSEAYLRHEEPHTLVIEGYSEPVPMAFVQARLLAPFIREKKPSVLDIGCFDGSLLTEIGKSYTADQLCGFDVGRRPQFPRNHPFRFVCGQLGTVGHCFDLILMSHSIQYIRDIHSLFEDIRKLLKPEGMVFIQAPDFSVKPTSLLLGDLYYHYTPYILGSILRRMGFCVRFLDNHDFPRDILVMASIEEGEGGTVCKDENQLDACLSRLVEMVERLDRLAASGAMGILGTTIDAAFVGHCLASRASFFVDENPRKVGSTFQSKPVVHPRSIREKDLVVIPMGGACESIRDRLTRHYLGSYVCL